MASDYGPTDCPDCGGSGTLPSRAVLADWRMSDIGRSLAEERPVENAHVQWLLGELRSARTALNEVIALAHDIRDDEQVALRIRMVASTAIGLYQVVAVDELRSPARPAANDPR